MYEVMPLALFVDRLKSAAELTRLRILLLLSRGDLTVSDITGILGQSQPRVSRHMKLLQEAGLISRHQEGAWALFRLSDSGSAGELVRDLCARIDLSDPVVERDLARLAAVKAERQRRAADYFSRSAARWDELRKLHVDEATVEAAVRSLVGDKPVHALLDIGTGTGRMLEMLAPLYRHGIGIDTNRDMLNVARANLDRAGIGHAHVSYGDAFSLPVGRDEYDLVIIHQVLHYLDEPDAVIGEAARALRPGGRLLIVDFAPHD
ncbi:MAG TPA: metalloregulator ArsR/SmtB family transcription factor, partial [Rhizobiaceae bacterium]|nr:metalloregulator ArsR/SmtB family transcription factor [Rhizobiaceae bacterium]